MAIHFNGKVFDEDHPMTEADRKEMLDWTQRENERWDKEAQKIVAAADNPLYERWEADQESISECGHL